MNKHQIVEPLSFESYEADAANEKLATLADRLAWSEVVLRPVEVSYPGLFGPVWGPRIERWLDTIADLFDEPPAKPVRPRIVRQRPSNDPGRIPPGLR